MPDVLKDIAVIIPAHQAAHTLAEVVSAALSSGISANHVIVVDDGSTDATGRIAASHDVVVLRNEAPEGPALARNKGAQAARAEILVFIDSDVVVHPGAIAQLVSHLYQGRFTAAIGSYDDKPRNITLVSRYRNLLHHHVHQTAGSEVPTFWTGFGAVRRTAFLEIGGFDPAWQNIEDVELGLRLTTYGHRIRLDREALCKHMKEWTIPSMFRTDLWGRAVPWTRLLAAERMPAAALNGGLPHRLSALGIAVAAAAVPATLLWSPAIALAVLGLASFAVLNAGLWQCLGRAGGLKLILVGAVCHAIHYLAGSLGYLYAYANPMAPRIQANSSVVTEKS